MDDVNGYIKLSLATKFQGTGNACRKGSEDLSVWLNGFVATNILYILKLFELVQIQICSCAPTIAVYLAIALLGVEVCSCANSLSKIRVVQPGFPFLVALFAAVMFFSVKILSMREKMPSGTPLKGKAKEI